MYRLPPVCGYRKGSGNDCCERENTSVRLLWGECQAGYRLFWGTTPRQILFDAQEGRSQGGPLAGHGNIAQRGARLADPKHGPVQPGTFQSRFGHEDAKAPRLLCGRELRYKRPKTNESTELVHRAASSERKQGERIQKRKS